MKVLELYFTSYKVTFADMTQQQVVDYLHSFHTPEEWEEYQRDFANACVQGWTHNPSDVEFYLRNGVEPLTIRSDTNTVIVRFIVFDIEKLCANVYDPPHPGVDPLRRQMALDSGFGVASMRLIDESENDVGSQYDYRLSL